MDNLTIIRQVIAAHRVIRGQIKQVGESINDQQALFNLNRESPNWIPGRLEMVTERQKKLEQTVNILEQGLKGHFALEEKSLLGVLGELGMEALIIDHQQIKKRLDEVKGLVADAGLEGLSPEKVVSHQMHMHQVINDMRQMVEEHAQREEVVLKWLERALEAKETQSHS